MSKRGMFGTQQGVFAVQTVGVICQAESGGDTSDFPPETLQGMNPRLPNKQTCWTRLLIPRVFRGMKFSESESPPRPSALPVTMGLTLRRCAQPLSTGSYSLKTTVDPQEIGTIPFLMLVV